MDWKRHLELPDPAGRALALFDAGFNCAESVLMALHPREAGEGLGCVATAFGAGVARKGLICGALSGCALAAGRAAERQEPGDQGPKEEAYRRMTEVMRRFEERFGALDCRTLTGLDFNIPEDRKRHEAEQRELCRSFVAFAVQAYLESGTPREGAAGA